MKNKKKSKKVWYRNIVKSIHKKDSLNQAKDRFSRFLELPQEVVSKATKLTIIQNTSILIEGYKQIIDYYDDYIKIKLNSMDVLIDGKALDIKEITDSDLVIEGNIYSINYQM